MKPTQNSGNGILESGHSEHSAFEGGTLVNPGALMVLCDIPKRGKHINLFFLLMSHIDSNGRVTIDTDAMARELGTKRKPIERALSTLEEAGLLIHEEGATGKTWRVSAEYVTKN